MDSQPKGPVAIINVFTVEPEHQQELLNTITSYSKGVASKWPGFISARFHAGLEKTRVIGVIYWESQEACLAFIQASENQPFFQQCTSLAQHIDSHFYTVVTDVSPN
jgi:heme-degrading monooxygenase HmoA